MEDCCTGVEHLAKEGKVDPDKATIDGGSAGGYTTLACLTFKDTFKAGENLFQISFMFMSCHFVAPDYAVVVSCLIKCSLFIRSFLPFVTKGQESVRCWLILFTGCLLFFLNFNIRCRACLF